MTLDETMRKTTEMEEHILEANVDPKRYP